MAEQRNPNDPFNLATFWRDLQDLEDGSLSFRRKEEIMALLHSSGAARRAYFEYFQQSVMFEMEGATMHEAGRLPVIGKTMPTPRLFGRSVMVAAAVTGLLAVIATFIVVRQPVPEVLTVRVAADTRWNLDGVSQSSPRGGFEIVEGSTVRVLSGTLELKLQSGTALVMQGPAEVSFPKPARPVLQHGWLWMDSGGKDEEFALQTPGFLIRDIGTRFGVRVPQEGPPEVHLIEGRVEVHQKNEGGKVVDLAAGGQAFAILAKGELQERELALDPFPDLPNLLAAEGNVHTTILSQSPSGYWKFEESRRGRLANEISGRIAAGHGIEVRLGEAGAGRQGDFGGFSPGNRSVYLSGHPQRSVILGLGGPDGVSMREGAVSFWIRRQPGRRQDEALWLAGRTSINSQEPTETDLYTGLMPSGKVCFCLGDRKRGRFLISPQNVRDGKWHHVAASWGPATVDLFVDGRLVARDGAPKQPGDHRLTGRYVRFGKPGQDWRLRGASSFQGWVDEIAMWPRPLTHEEVLHQFESAKGSSKQ